MQKRYDVVIVGSGPAGIFAALELARKSSLSVLMVEKGKDIGQRTRSGLDMLFGWGGAGAFSDGKLTFSTEVGGWLSEYVGEAALKELLDEVDKVYLEFGAPSKVYGADEDKVAEIARRASMADLKLVPAKLRHIGTDIGPMVIAKMRSWLEGRVDIRTETPVTKILTEGGKVAGVELETGERIEAKYVVAAVGRGSSGWLVSEAERLGIPTEINPVDIGIRVEVPAAVMEHLTDVLYEPKFVYYTKAFDDKVRTFCVAPRGFVVTEQVDDVLTVNGHSYAWKKSDNTNFAILVSTKFTEPFRDPISYAKYIAKLANMLVGGVIVQRLGDLVLGRRSTPERVARSIVEPTLKEAKPGDLSFVLPSRYLIDIKEMLRALDKVAPGIYSLHTLLYGVEVKLYSVRLKLSRSLETTVRNLFAIGDGAGITRGLVQASASGLIAARSIMRREGARA